ncbi:hypothetical protein D3C81_905610 [compost metagenome]
MHVALVEDAEHDVHRHQRQQDQPGHVVLGLLHRAGVAFEAGLHVERQVDRLQRGHHRVARRADQGAGSKVEGEGGRGELAVVVDRQRRAARFVVGEGRQRHLLPIRADHVDLLEHLRRLLVLLAHFHHHAVLVERVEDGGNLPLAEGVVEHAIHRCDIHAKAGGAVAVDHQARLHALVLGVAVDVGELRHLLQHRLHLRRPFAEQRQVVAAQGEFVLRVALPAADAHVLASHQIERRPRNLGKLLAQPRGHRLSGIALADRLEADEERAGVARHPLAATDEADHVLHRRVLGEDLAEARHLLFQRLEGNALVGHREAAQAPRILRWQEALGHHGEQVEVERDAAEQDHHHQPRMLQRPAQAGAVTQHEGGEQAIATACQRSLRRAVDGAQQARAEHRREGQGDDQRNHHRRRQGHGELAEQPAGDAAHQQQRDEHGDQREGHRQHGEAHLAGAAQGRLQGAVALLDPAGDVLHHDDGVVHHEAGGDDQRHQRQVVQREAAQVHHGEGADQRHRHRQAGDQRGAAVAQEQPDHQDHQRHRDEQGQLGLFQRSADRRAAVVHHVQLDPRAEHVLEDRQLLVDGVGSLDDVRPRLAADDQQHRRQVVGEAGVAHVFDAVADLRHVLQAHGGAGLGVVVDDDRRVFGGLAQLVVGVHLPVAVVLLQRALGPVGVGVGHRVAHAFQRQAVMAEQVRIEVDTHRRQRTAADAHLPHPFHLRQARRHDGRREVVHLATGVGIRGEREDHDRLIRRVRLAVRRIVRHAGGQQARRRVDCRLHFAGGAVDVLGQVELHHDGGVAQRAAGGHLGDPGDAPERALQRGRHRRGHGFRAGAG